VNGFYNVYKTPDMTSSDVVVKLRGILRSRTGVRFKVGHLGTLDPLAEGVLPVAVGSATKLFNYMLDKRKRYLATFVWGETTDTLDRAGQVTATAERVEDVERVSEAAIQQVGRIMQTPPAYSAKSVDGARAYQLARNGVEVALPPKEVTVYSIELVAHEANAFSFVIECSAGTYIRAICRDMAASMGTVGYMSKLTRTQSGEFALSGAVTLAQIEEDICAGYVSLADFAASLKCYNIDEQYRKHVENGVVYPMQIDQSYARIDVGGVPYAIGCTQEGVLKIICRL